MIWTCCAAMGPGQFAVTQLKVVCSAYQNYSRFIWEAICLTAIRSCTRTMIPNTPPNLPKSWLKNKRIEVLQWPSQRPDLNLIWMSVKLNELKQCYNEKWVIIPQQQTDNVIERVSHVVVLRVVLIAKSWNILFFFLFFWFCSLHLHFHIILVK